MYGNKPEDVLKKKWAIADLNQTALYMELSVKEQRVYGGWHKTFCV